ncbi:MAG: PAS domain S-box protein [Rhodoferax sp.]|nr:PAS domain S-box protein [Rhodoferax sp.]
MMEKLSDFFDKGRHMRQDSDTKLKEYVLDNVLDAAYLMDRQLRFVYVNEEACSALGYSRGELLGLTPADINPHTTPEEGARIWAKILAEGRISFEASHRRRDGSEFPVEIRVTLFEYLGQTMQLALVRNISERRRMESDIAVREHAYRSLAENLPDNIARWDVDGRYLYINATHEQTLAMSAADVIGKTIHEVFPDGLFRVIEAAIAQTIKDGRAVLFARQAVPVNGETKFHDIKFAPERDANGQIVSVLGIGRDMTELYRAQDDLAARERELRALAESSPGMMGSYHLRADGSIYMPYISPKIETLFGLHPQDVARDASALRALNHPDDAQRVADSIAESARTMRTWHEEYRIVHPTLGERWMESNTHPESHPDGGTIWYGHVHDITERKQAQLERDYLRDQLRGMAAKREEVREEERRHIARELHDELGQILSALNLNLIVLSRKFSQDVPALREQLAQTTELTDKAIGVTRNIASALRPVALDLGFVPALEWLAQCFESNTGIPIEIHAQGKGIELDEQHAIALFRIVQEALTNVTRHAQALSVTIILKQDAGDHILIVRDDGTGFDTHAKKPNSFGLVGMKERALMLGGALCITSEVGGGAEITVRIPIQGNKEAL